MGGGAALTTRVASGTINSLQVASQPRRGSGHVTNRSVVPRGYGFVVCVNPSGGAAALMGHA